MNDAGSQPSVDPIAASSTTSMPSDPIRTSYPSNRAGRESDLIESTLSSMTWMRPAVLALDPRSPVRAQHPACPRALGRRTGLAGKVSP